MFWKFFGSVAFSLSFCLAQSSIDEIQINNLNQQKPDSDHANIHNAPANETSLKQESNSLEKIMKVNMENGKNQVLVDGDIIPQMFRNAGNTQLWIKHEAGDRKGLVDIPYKFTDEYSASNRKMIKDTMQKIHKHTCIRFIPKTNQTLGSILFRNLSSCSSHVGRSGYNNQPVSLAIPRCMHTRIILHELMHAIGFYHEHQRSDRDRYIKVHYENISKKKRENFLKLNTNNLVVYDYNSILQYGSPRDSPTMTVQPKRNPSPVLGGYRLTSYDIEEVKYLYKCEPGTYERCGKDFFNQRQGRFHSPWYPNKYTSNTHCTWNITVRQGRRVQLQIRNQRLQKHPLCARDMILIHDGSNAGAPRVRRLCGRKSKVTITSTGKSLFVIFSTDGSFEYSGFRAEFKEVTLRKSHSVRIRNNSYSVTNRKLHSGLPFCPFESKKRSKPAKNSPEYIVKDLGPYIYPDPIYNDKLCGLKQEKKIDSFDWIRRKGATPSLRTGPLEDKTTGRGYYVYIEATSRSFNESAFLQTHSMPASHYCIDFGFHMKGKFMGRLVLRSIEKLRNNQTVSKTFQIVGHQGDHWRNAKIDFFSHKKAKSVSFRFEGYVGERSSSDIAIDDLTIYPGKCNACEKPDYEYLSNQSGFQQFSTGCTNNEIFWVQCCSLPELKFVHRHVKKCKKYMFDSASLNWFCQNS